MRHGGETMGAAGTWQECLCLGLTMIGALATERDRHDDVGTQATAERRRRPTCSTSDFKLVHSAREEVRSACSGL